MSKAKDKKQFLMFCLVGLINTVLDLSMYFFLHQIMEMPTYIASPLVVFTVMSLSYILNAKLVFFSMLSLRQYAGFMALTGLGVIAIQTTISTLFENWAQEFLLDISILSSQELNIFIANSLVRITGVVFSLAWNFLFYKYVVFKIRENRDINLGLSR